MRLPGIVAYHLTGGGEMDLPIELQEEMQRNILSRLRKIEGQIRGLQGMVSGNQDCEQILTQMRAAQSALKSVGTLILKSYLMKCSRELGPEPTPADVLRKLEKTVVVLTKFIGG
jgi:CsoR family transcriptional regulator, copper-sensing transcriptional repressor